MGYAVLGELSAAVVVAGQATWVVTGVAALVLVLMLVALGGFVYESVTGDGIRWPDEASDETPDEENVERGRADDEWDYY
jgi:hypothetical protein